jgi:hypothetical protein
MYVSEPANLHIFYVHICRCAATCLLEADVDDSQCLDDKISASQVDLPPATQVNSNAGPGTSCFVPRRKFALASTNAVVALTSIKN